MTYFLHERSFLLVFFFKHHMLCFDHLENMCKNWIKYTKMNIVHFLHGKKRRVLYSLKLYFLDYIPIYVFGEFFFRNI